MQQSDMPPPDDVRLVASSADRLLSDLRVFSCSGCRIVFVGDATTQPQSRYHARCGGRWTLVDQVLPRTLILRFHTREMFRRRSTEGLN
jgi:hypothetical protein